MRRRLLTTVVISAALCIPASVATVGLSSGAAFAKGKTGPSPTAGSSVDCTKMKFKSKPATKTKPASSSVVISKCYTAGGVPTASGFATLENLTNAIVLLSGGNLTWKSSNDTLVAGALTSAPPLGTCPVADTNTSLTGNVVSATGGPALGGDVEYVDVCVAPSGAVTIASGTQLEF
jgi:hypothetical protein